MYLWFSVSVDDYYKDIKPLVEKTKEALFPTTQTSFYS